MAASAQLNNGAIFGRKVFPEYRRYGIYGNMGETVGV
jgi:hypothetical protein